MTRREPPRVAVLGGGPVGVEAALYAASLGLGVRLYERGDVGDHLKKWGHVKLFTPFAMNATPLGFAALRADAPRRALPSDSDLLTGREHLAAYLEPLAAGSLLAGKVETKTHVLSVGRKGYLKGESPTDPRRAAQPFRLLLRGPAGERVEEADVVLDCTGTYGSARHLGDGGVPAIGELEARPHLAWGLEDVLGERRAHYADRTVLVAGAGYTAATTVSLLAKLAAETPGTWIIWLSRRAGSQPIRRVLDDPLRERDHLAARANMLATRGEGHVEFHAQAQVQTVERKGADAFIVRALVGGEEREWQVERVIANVGYRPDDDPTRELLLREAVEPPGAGAALRQPEPNFFVLGQKSYGRHSTFLLRHGFEQVRDVFALISAKTGLDLYKKARG